MINYNEQQNTLTFKPIDGIKNAFLFNNLIINEGQFTYDI